MMLYSFMIYSHYTHVEKVLHLANKLGVTVRHTYKIVWDIENASSSNKGLFAVVPLSLWHSEPPQASFIR